MIDTDAQLEALETWLDETGVVGSIKGHGRRINAKGWQHNSYSVTFSRGSERLSTPFFTGVGWETDPTAIDVLNSLNSDYFAGELDYDEFVSDFGYDDDDEDHEGRKESRRVHKACREIKRQMDAFFTADELRSLNHLVADY